MCRSARNQSGQSRPKTPASSHSTACSTHPVRIRSWRTSPAPGPSSPRGQSPACPSAEISCSTSTGPASLSLVTEVFHGLLTTSGGEPIASAAVSITDASGVELAAVTTDAQGAFEYSHSSFPRGPLLPSLPPTPARISSCPPMHAAPSPCLHPRLTSRRRPAYATGALPPLWQPARRRRQARPGAEVAVDAGVRRTLTTDATATSSGRRPRSLAAARSSAPTRRSSLYRRPTRATNASARVLPSGHCRWHPSHRPGVAGACRPRRQRRAARVLLLGNRPCPHSLGRIGQGRSRN